jgi:hypothetical protein
MTINVTVGSAGGAGTVTSISTGSGLTGGTITSTGTISLASSGVTAGTYGSVTVGTLTSAVFPQVSADSFGRVTSVSLGTIPFANAGTAGLLSALDWTTFNSKLSNVVAGTGLLVGATSNGTISGSGGTLNINVGTGVGQIVQMQTGSKLPAVDGSSLTNLLMAQFTSGTLSTARGGTGLASVGSANQLLGVGTGGSVLEYKSIVAGSNVTITNSSGTMVINAINTGSISLAITNNRIPRYLASTLVDSAISDATTGGSFGKVTVYGQFNNATSAVSTVSSGTVALDLDQGNIQYTTDPCGGGTGTATIKVSNTQDAGSYSVGVKVSAGTCTVSFATSDGGVNQPHLAGESTGTTSVPVSAHTVFSFVRMGADIYVTWVIF